MGASESVVQFDEAISNTDEYDTNVRDTLSEKENDEFRFVSQSFDKQVHAVRHIVNGDPELSAKYVVNDTLYLDDEKGKLYKDFYISPGTLPEPGSISPLLINFKKGSSHTNWLLAKPNGKILRFETHGNRPDVNTENIKKALPGVKLVFQDDRQPKGVGVCRALSTYFLVSYLRGDRKLGMPSARRLKMLDQMIDSIQTEQPTRRSRHSKKPNTEDETPPPENSQPKPVSKKRHNNPEELPETPQSSTNVVQKTKQSRPRSTKDNPKRHNTEDETPPPKNSEPKHVSKKRHNNPEELPETPQSSTNVVQKTKQSRPRSTKDKPKKPDTSGNKKTKL